MRLFKLLLLLLTGLCQQLHSIAAEKGLQSMLADGKVWNYTLRSPDGDQLLTVVADGDTIVNNQTCHKLYLCTDKGREIYGCYYEDLNSYKVCAYIMQDAKISNGRLMFVPLEEPTFKTLFVFSSRQASWGDFFESCRFATMLFSYYDNQPDGFSFLYDLVKVDDRVFARVNMPKNHYGRAATWVSGVGDSLWGILLESAEDVSPYITFEGCSEQGRAIFSHDDFSRQALESAYRPFVEENKVWTYKNSDEQPFIYRYHMKGDTIIDGQRCLKLYGSNLDNSGKTVYVGAFRESNRKVYYYPAGQTKANYLYNFALQAGEQDDFTGTFIGDVKTTKIADAYEIGDGGIVHIHIFSETKQFDPQKFGEWVEGVGPANWFDLTMAQGFSLMGFSGERNLLDCSVSGQSIYRTSLFDEYTGIEDINRPPYQQREGLYDLQGRRLKQKPVKGMYIQDGRKVIAR